MIRFLSNKAMLEYDLQNGKERKEEKGLRHEII